ncbi:phosphate acetyltransferase, partial [Burkholderia multivorans]|nr:phosphate acetyltransferase [Burkholderia multivorans]
ARDAVLDPLCHANLMVRLGDADGSVAGAVHATADVVRAAIQLIGVDPAFRLVSSFFLMMLCEPFHTIKGGLIFSDCALVVDPDAEQLAEIAMAAADSAQALLGETPRVAMLSFSTSGSAHHAAVDKVTAATERVGPLLQGLRRPANDLSRGCSADDVYHVIAATTVQAQAAAQRVAASEAAPA